MMQLLNLAFQGFLLVLAFIALAFSVMIVLLVATYLLDEYRKRNSGLNHERKGGDD